MNLDVTLTYVHDYVKYIIKKKKNKSHRKTDKYWHIGNINDDIIRLIKNKVLDEM